MTSLKAFFSPALVRQLARDLQQVDRGFPARRFVERACRGLDALELLERARHIARALAEHLPPSYPEAVGMLLRTLGPENPRDEVLGDGMAPFVYLPHLLYIAEHGRGDFDLSMRAQYEITKRCSAEFSIRPFIADDPDRAFATLRSWAADPNPHVRRLVSEGTRMRLPWAARVEWLDAHPERIVELLEALKDDPSPMVRRSVANNLNDLGKVHPAILNRTASRWLRGASEERRALVRHALRSAVRRGDPEALRLLGYRAGSGLALESVRITPKGPRVGGAVDVRFILRNANDRPIAARAFVAVHFVKARGTSAKRFSAGSVTVPAGGRAELAARISLAVHTTRTPRPGEHRVEIVVNGQVHAAGSFRVLP